MRSGDKTKVYSAVQECLARCYGSKNPLVQATNFVSQLRNDPHWDDSTIAEVESLLFRAVKVIVRQPRSGCCQGTSNGA